MSQYQRERGYHRRHTSPPMMRPPPPSPMPSSPSQPRKVMPPGYILSRDLSPILFSDDPPAFPLPHIGNLRLVRTSHGLGLTASRKIESGECLMLLRPAVSAPVSEVFRRLPDRRADAASDERGRPPLEIAAEEILLEAAERTVSLAYADAGDERAVRAAAALLCLRGHDDERDLDESEWPGEVSVGILAMAARVEPPRGPAPPQDVTVANLMGIQRKNAFGPEYHSYDRMSVAGLAACTKRYSRVLSHYPLAAMINHSCVPNAARFYHADRKGEIMAVHACRTIQKDEEIVWSYVPVVSSWEDRVRQIERSHDFCCRCPRCRDEEGHRELSDELKKVAEDNNDDLQKVAKDNYDVATGMNRLFLDDHERARYKMERIESALAVANAQMRLSLRVSLYATYVDCFNRMLLAPDSERDMLAFILRLATQLHLAMHMVHPGSTEHLSLLHLCYDLVGAEHSLKQTDKSLSKVRFWTEQLKKGHVARYGRLGGNVESMRTLMKHTRGVVRDKDGWRKARWKFI